MKSKCPNFPADGVRRKVGVCHVCAMRERLPPILKMVAGDRGREVQSVGYCAGCCHWFCNECWNRVMGRFTGFIEQFVRHTPNCCGPEANGVKDHEEALPEV